MNKLFRLIQYYLVIGLPFVIACMIWQTVAPITSTAEHVTPFIKMLQQVLGINVMAWFSALILFLISLVAIPSVREKTLCRLANLKERDEREEYITGKASRAAYISTLSLIIFLLFFSIFSFNISKLPQTSTEKAKFNASIGLRFSFLNRDEQTTPPQMVPTGNVIFDSTQITLSSSAMILILLSWQLFIFNYTARKEQMKG